MTTETREYICELTDEELVSRSQEQNQLLYEVSQLEAERRAINLEIKPKNERVDELMYIIRNRRERRDVTCQWHYDWEKGVKILYRTDTGAEVDRRVIEPHERQQRLLFPVQVEPSLFTGCPSCAYSKTNPCAPVLCGNFHMIHKSIPGPCEHPVEHRIEESNVITCGICKTVLDAAEFTRSLQPVAMEEDAPEEYVPEETVCFNTDCNQFDKSEPNGCRNLEHAFECDSFTPLLQVEYSDEPIGDETDISEPVEHAPLPIDKNRTCCMPGDRTIATVDGSQIMYCKVCNLIHKKTSASGEPIPFIIGEKFTPPVAAGDDSWPDPPEGRTAA